MKYRLRQDGSLLFESELRAHFSNVSMPSVLTSDTLDSLGVDGVLETPQPNTTDTQTAAVIGVEQDALGNWIQTWQVTDMTPDQIAAKQAEKKQAAANTIDQLERDSMMNRGVREITLRLMEQQATAQANGDVAMYNQILSWTPAYVKFKALDDQIAQLRRQL